MKIPCPQCNAEHELPDAIIPMADGERAGDAKFAGEQGKVVCDNCNFQFGPHQSLPVGERSKITTKFARPARRIIVVPSKSAKRASVSAIADEIKPLAPVDRDNATFSIRAGDIGGEIFASKQRVDKPIDPDLEDREKYPPEIVPSTRKKWINIVAVIGAIMIFGGGLIVRDRVVSVLPNLSSLYSFVGLGYNFRGLEFASVTSKTQIKNGGNILIIEGMIRNVSKSTVKVPAVRLLMRAADKQEIYAWFYEPEQKKLEPGETMKFVTHMFGPPSDVRDIHLKFTERRSQQAKLN